MSKALSFSYNLKHYFSALKYKNVQYLHYIDSGFKYCMISEKKDIKDLQSKGIPVLLSIEGH
jgi:hypothetical protein